MSRGKRKAALVAVPLLALGVVAGGAYALLAAEDEVELQTAAVARATVREVVEAPGQVVARASVDITSPASGTVATLAVDDGARVQAGQVLLRIDSPAARARLRQAKEADAELAASTPDPVELGPTGAVQEQAEEADRTAREGFAQAREAAELIPDAQARSAALAQVTAAESQYDLARRAAEQTLDRLNDGAGSLSTAVAAVVRAQRLQTQAAIDVARRTVDGLVVRAPIAGVVTFGAPSSGGVGGGLEDALGALPGGLAGQASELLGGAAGAGGGSGAAGTPVVAEGVPVDSGAALLTITDDSAVSLTADIDETDILLVRKGVEAGVELDAVPGARYDAAVTSVDANPASSAAGSVSYRVRLSLSGGELADGSDAPLPRPGMSAVVDLTVRTAEDAVSVPATAVFRQGDRDAVWVVEAARVQARPVVLGAQGEDLVQVTSGLRAGEQVVIAGADQVTDGQRVA